MLHCAPCLSDLALVREAVTSVGGTAACTAHAVLLRHPGDDPARRRRRLAELRSLAEGRLADATGMEHERLELLVQEYAVAEAMDLGAPDRQGPGRLHEPRGRRGKPRRPGEFRRPDRVEAAGATAPQPEPAEAPGGEAPAPEPAAAPEPAPNPDREDA